ncbi:hypothetical protein DL766_010398 [Monosporascus sp. MC13-8B]|uniref:Uncharacterized protein n=1 Tax=Monosporascus cannonballus TaxID=155416 RepID=A0ABY0HBV8_9PEZI|nr:hypothetical protein DL762_002952 [Monosporascus cannonballus]RYO96603.1 hypothetical protein DL763_003089 [Monosporascus cannonballus]RYP02361.1 hypothetical protein DL766_010398 [Monosporascus sp. MC13-8B]
MPLGGQPRGGVPGPPARDSGVEEAAEGGQGARRHLGAAYQDEEGGNPDRRLPPSFGSSAGRAIVDGGDDDEDDYPCETPGNEIAPYDTEEEERREEARRWGSRSEPAINTDKWNSWDDDDDGMSDDKFDKEDDDDDEAGSVVADADAWEAVDARDAVLRVAGVPVHGACWTSCRAGPEGKETRDNVNALAERLLEMDEQELLEFCELAESCREDLLEQGVNIKGHIYNQCEREEYYYSRLISVRYALIGPFGGLWEERLSCTAVYFVMIVYCLWITASIRYLSAL